MLAIAAGALAVGARAAAAPARCTRVAADAIVDFTPPVAGYLFLRAGRPVPLRIFADLAPDDQLQVTRRGGSLLVRGLDGRDHTLTFGSGRICIDAPATGNIVTNALRQLGSLITQRILRTTPGVGRGEEENRLPLRLAPPDLAAGTARVPAGRRPFAVAWAGGRPPFSVSVTGATGESLVQYDGLEARVLILEEPRMLRQGRYCVRIDDSAGLRAEGGFTAIAPPAAPVPVNPGAGGSLFEAARLYGAGAQFDAFLLLAPHYEANRTATEFVELLREAPVATYAFECAQEGSPTSVKAAQKRG